ncbi:MAG: sugar phosphate nucleotidyltransferase [archaeon]
MKNKISITINEKILRDVDSIVDNIFIRNRSQAIEHLIKKSMKETKIAIILAGDGLNNSSEKIKNRYSLKINHLTIIEHAIKKFHDTGFRTIYIVAPRETLTNIFKIVGDGSNFNVKIEYIDEEVQEGSASALKLLNGKIKTTFLVVQCDLIITNIDLLDLWNKHLQEKAIATMLICSEIQPKNQIRYGHVSLNGNKIISYCEKPLPKNLKSSIFFAGIFVSEPEILRCHGKSLEFDVFPELAKRGLLAGHISNLPHFHIHTREDLERVKKSLNEMERRK